MIAKSTALVSGRWALLGALVLLIAIATAAFAACGDDGDDSEGELTAQSILDESAENVVDLESFHLALDVSIDLSGFESETTMEGDFEPPDKSYFAIQIGSETTETLVLNSDVWERSSLGGQWQQITSEAATVSPEDYLEIAQGLGSGKLSEAAGDITLLADDSIDGHEAYHLSGALDVAGALTLFQGPGLFPAGDIIDPSTIEGQMDVDSWVSKEDLLPLLLRVAGDLSVSGAEINVTANIELSDINAPITFPSPE
jgi:hypothetical protein